MSETELLSIMAAILAAGKIEEPVRSAASLMAQAQSHVVYTMRAIEDAKNEIEAELRTTSTSGKTRTTDNF